MANGGSVSSATVPQQPALSALRDVRGTVHRPPRAREISRLRRGRFLAWHCKRQDKMFVFSLALVAALVLAVIGLRAPDGPMAAFQALGYLALVGLGVVLLITGGVLMFLAFQGEFGPNGRNMAALTLLGMAAIVAAGALESSN